MTDDLISRQAAISAVYESSIGRQMIWGHRDLIRTLKNLPSARPEPQKAIWALHTYMPHNYYCTHCKKDSPYNKTWSYCPNCGCEMEGHV